MNKSRLVVGLLLVAFLMLLAPVSHAQTATNCQSANYQNGAGQSPKINCNIIAVGSETIFPTAAIAAILPDPTRGNGPLCNGGVQGATTHFWTGSASGYDSRNTVRGVTIPNEPGTVWIAWDNDTAPTIICVYLSVDSIVGQRLFYGQGAGLSSSPTNNGKLLLIPDGTKGAACTTAGGNKVAFVWDTATTGLPPAIYNALQGGNATPTTGGVTSCNAATAPVNFTTASTDVSPIDAEFLGNNRVTSYDSAPTAGFPGDTKFALGYDGPNYCVGPAVSSAWEMKIVANSVCYTHVIGATDPISQDFIASTQVASEGAVAMLPVINITHNASGSGGFGDLFNNHGFNNVLSRDIAAGYAWSQYGTAALTRDLFTGSGASSLPIVAVHYLMREPQSGSYITFDWQVLRQKDGLFGGGELSQETNVCGPSQLAFGCPYTTPSANPGNCPNQANNLMNGTFPATSTCSNYASWGANGINALKTRVVGTDEMVGVANIDCSRPGLGPACDAEDQFGYAFWSLANFAGKTAIRYLQLDGSDGLYPGWNTVDGGNAGLFPGIDPNQGKLATGLTAPTDGCAGYFNGNGSAIQSFTCNSWSYPTFPNIVSGSYRNWSINRVMWFSPFQGTVTPNWTTLNPPAFWLSTADQAAPIVAGHGTIPDFMPFGYCASAAACPDNVAPTLTYPLNAFRSHYALLTWWNVGFPANGITANGFGGVENGGDVAGAIITVQAEADTVNTAFWGAGATFINWLQ